MKRQARTLSDALERQLKAYAVAASAAGVGGMALMLSATEYAVPTGAALVSLLALSEPARAKIVYTPVRLKLPCTDEGSGNGLYQLDLNRDKIADFNLYCHGNSGDGGGVWIGPVNKQNKIWTASTTQYRRKGWAAALSSGVAIKPNRNFQTGDHGMMGWETGGTTFQISGPWVDLTNRYLGLKFLVKGKPHFGWARLNVAFRPNFTHATLTGYAYETVPNKPIITGKTKDK